MSKPEDEPENQNISSPDPDPILKEQEKYKLNRSWSFWENYEESPSPSTNNNAKKPQQDYSNLLKEIYSFSDLIEFWQFWNRYPGSTPSNIFFDGTRVKYFFEEKYRIIAMNLFVKNIKPEWEEEKNKGGKIFVLEYFVASDLEKFLELIKEAWTKLLCLLIGETIPNSLKINGVRFVDKTKVGSWKKTKFRFEVWVCKEITEKEIGELKEFLKTTFECEGIIIKDIEG